MFRTEPVDGTRAVSPVIGVILMVAITVILAAVIATFVLGIGDTGDVAPQTSFDSTVDGEQVVVQISSGDSLEVDDLEIRSNDGFDCENAALAGCTDDLDDGDRWGVGESIALNTESGGEVSGNLVWTGDGEDVLKRIEASGVEENSN